MSLRTEAAGGHPLAAALQSVRRAGRRLIKLSFLLAALAVYRPLRDALRTLRRRHPVRVFTFHRVTDVCRDGMTVHPRVFRRQLEYLRRFHQVVGVEEALGMLKVATRLSRPVAVITFDDGYKSVVEGAKPAMDALGLKGCCFVTTDLVGTDRRFPHDLGSPVLEHLGVMDWGQLLTLLDCGWSVGGHSASHARFSECDRETLERELRTSLSTLRERLGLRSVTMAYPFGGPDDITPEALHLVAECGFAACFSDYDGEAFPPADPYRLGRTELGGNHETLAWKARVHGIDLSLWRMRRRRG
jgi:peptidoglycan/xylan/chitin deacetylase (PgdA/CDA1 family)